MQLEDIAGTVILVSRCIVPRLSDHRNIKKKKKKERNET